MSCRWLDAPQVSRLLLVLIIAVQLQLAAARDASDLYCGKDNCYALLGLDRRASAVDIKKAYRKLALQWHPDKNRSPEAPEKFRKISRAHEVLSEDKLRSAYDYFLDHPEEAYTHYYQYYHAVYAPQTPLWMVITGVLLFLSGLQYINQQWRYSSMMNAVRHQPTFKRRVNEMLEAELRSCKGKLSKAEKEILKAKVETDVLETQVQLSGNGFAKPSVKSLIGVKAAVSPYYFVSWSFKSFKWFWRFNVLGEAYGEEEQAYLTRSVLGIGDEAWNQLPEEKRQEFLSKTLWVPEKANAFFTEMQEEQNQKLAQSAAYRRYKRWQRNH